MIKRQFPHSLYLLFLAPLVFFACKGNRQAWDGELWTSVDNGFADSEFSVVRMIIDADAQADTLIYGRTTGTQAAFCPQASVNVTSTGSNSARLTIDFGSGVNCIDGRLRTGRLIADFNGKWKDAGSTCIITPESYTVNGYAFSFTETITVNSPDINGDPNWHVVVENARLIHPQNGIIDWECDRTTTWTEGHGDLDPQNNVYEVTGTAAGTSRQDINFTINIDQPLIVRGDCQHIVQGVISNTPQNFTTRTIDYGLGPCDNRAVLTVGAYQQEIFLP